MLTSLDFIAKGKSWPPEDKDEKDRREEHAKNRKLYSELHEEILPKYQAYLRDKQDDDKKVVILLGWAEIATDSYLNLLLGEDPEVDAPVLYDRPDEEVFIDCSRYGLGLYEVHQEGINAANPENCYIVVTSGNIRKVQAYVFFQEFELLQDKALRKFIKFTIHQAGTIQHLVYELKDGKLGDLQVLTDFQQFTYLKVDAEGKQSTGVNELLIVRVDNKFSSERYYGQSDYSPVVFSLIEALELAFARRAEVLAKFTRPKPMAGESAFRFDHAKQTYVWKTEEAIMVEAGDPPAQYLTWQAQLVDVETEINGLMDQLLMKLKLSKVLLAGSAGQASQADSGRALQIRLIPTTSKVRKFASALKQAVPHVLSLKSKLDVALRTEGQVGEASFEPDAVTIKIKDGIPADPVENAQVRLSKAQTIVVLVNARVLDAKAALRMAVDCGILKPEYLLPSEDPNLEDGVTQVSRDASANIL